MDEKLIKRFEKYAIPEPNTGCWLWAGATLNNVKKPYGRFLFNGKNKLAHRVSYIIYNGQIPDGMLVCHKCDNHSCVNPDHLFIGTPQDNVDDMMSKGRNKQPARRLRGEEHPLNKYPDSLIIQIRNLSTEGLNYYDIGRMFNIHPAYIGSVVRRTRRKNI